MQEIQAVSALNDTGDVIRPSRPNPKQRRGSVSARGSADARLANSLLGHLPLGVAVVDEETRLLFWNEQAAALFGIPPMIAVEMPYLTAVLHGVAKLTAPQREEVVRFVTSHVAMGDRAEPDSCLRVSIGRDLQITIRAQGIGSGQWMLVFDDGKMAGLTGRSPAKLDAEVSWLDALTGLSNRRHFSQALRKLVESSTPDTAHSVLMIDLDGFKSINDTLGPPIGDALLCLVAQRLRREARGDDLLARLGGDEFVILLANSEQAEPLAARIVDVLSRPFLVEGNIATISASIGIVQFPDHGATGDDLVRYAELALYEAKRAGRRTWRVFKPAMATGLTEWGRRTS